MQVQLMLVCCSLQFVPCMWGSELAADLSLALLHFSVELVPSLLASANNDG